VSSYREDGKIVSIFAGKEDHGILTVGLGVEFRTGHQGFGGLAFDNDGIKKKAFLADLCAVFGVSDHEQLVGRPCVALRCFDTWNSPIEGLESTSGKRFVLTDWRRKHWPEIEILDPLEERIAAMKRDLARLRQDAKDLRARIPVVKANYRAAGASS
jgi:hypothetical protein